ncbi:MAG: transglutaminase-like domain-containing protein [Puniceicoccales bacterium]
MKFPFSIALLLLSFFSASAQTFSVDIDVDNPPEGIFSEDWAEMFINGEKVGYTHTLLERQGPEILTVEETYLQLGRGPTSITSISTSKTRETLEGAPLSLNTVTREGERTKTQNITFTPEGALIATHDGARSWTNDVTLEPGYVLSWSFVRAMEKANLAPGETLKNRIYVPDLVLSQALPVSTTMIGEEDVSLDGELHEAMKIEQTLQLGFLPLKVTAWIRGNGNLLRMDMPLGGMDITLLGSNEEKARASFSPPDLFTNTLIPLNRPIPLDALSVTFLVKTNGEVVRQMPESAYQSVQPIDDGTFAVRVRRGALRFSEPSPVESTYLEPSPLVNFEDPAILYLLAQAEIDSLAPEEKVRRLVAIADESIAIKSMDLGFATASETVALSEGDCTEHSLLLTALCRAADIPARGASGLVYFPTEDGNPVMGYHMWTQIWNGAEWLDIDAAFGTAEPEPIRILFSTSDLMDPSLTEDILVLTQYLGQTAIEIESVTEPE